MRAIIITLVTLTLAASTAWGVPRYSVRYSQSCILCHVDPSGGGARSLYGAQFFAYTDLAMKALPMDQLSTVKPMLNDQLQIGLDGRVQAYGMRSTRARDRGASTFMTMQGNLYLTFQLDPKWTFYLNKGLYQGFELWGMGHILPDNGYLKAGRTTPPYGLHLADHKAFLRGGSRSGAGLYETGLEIGFHPEHYTLAVAATTGTDNASTEFAAATMNKAVTGRADLRFSFDKIGVLWGLTGRYNDTAGSGSLDGRQARYGGTYGGLSYKGITFLGETDLHDAKPGAERIRQLDTFAELSWVVSRGVLLRIEHDYSDPNRDLRSGDENMFVLGAEIVPRGFLQVIANLRYHDIETGPDYPGDHYYEGEIQLHFFF